MENIPNNLKYVKTHEWVKIEGDVATVGITEYAQSLLGDLVYVELPEVGDTLEMGDDACVVESVKAASDVYAPVGGEVLEVNEDLVDSPEQINKSPFESGWLFKLKISDQAEVEGLLSAEEYSACIEE